MLLIGVQVGASALLLICAAVFLRSAFAAAQASPGLRTRDTIRVPIANEPRRAAIVREVTAHPSVVAVAASSRARWRRLPSPVKRRRTRDRPTPQKRGEAWPSTTSSYRRDTSSCSRSISSEGAVSRRRRARRDAGVTVVSESAARRLWPNGDALGQVVRIQAIIRQPAPSAHRPAPSPSSALHEMCAGGLMQFFSFSGVYLPSVSQDPGTSLTAACPRGSRPSASRFARSPHAGRSGPRPRSPDDADHRRHGRLYPADRLLGDAATRRAGAGADGVGPLQRPLVSRRAARQGNRRADGPWRDDTNDCGTGVVAIGPPGRLRSSGRWRTGRSGLRSC